MNICREAANISTRFERLNNDLKRRYYIKNIERINTIMEHTPGFYGSFGTGYPFYVLNDKLEGELPIINEQIRYNNELIDAVGNSKVWECEDCLNTRGIRMSDLKSICLPCPRVNNNIKPRKMINRLPDIDMWMICHDDLIESAKTTLSSLFNSYNMYTSDINPVRTVKEVGKIVNDLETGKMPKEMLPLDIHIIGYNEFASLLDEIPFSILYAMEENNTPYLPIHPISLRKTWQYDDVAYNFVLDFLFSLTPFNWEKKLYKKLEISRKVVYETFSNEDLQGILDKVSPDSLKRRMENESLKKGYERRLTLWRK